MNSTQLKKLVILIPILALIFTACTKLASTSAASPDLKGTVQVMEKGVVIKPQGPIISFDSNKWEITGEYKKEVYLGQKSLRLKSGGFAIINDSEFNDGIIEFDVALPEARGFAGVIWRLEDSDNYEEFYLRAHQSGNPDANQYTPVFNGSSAWQLYLSGAGFGAPIRYPFNKWMHVKIVVSGQQAEMYLNDMGQPAVSVELLRNIKTGKVGVKVSGAPNSPFQAHFANFSYSNASMPLKRTPKNIITAKEGTILSWSVSNLIQEKSLAGKTSLIEKDKNLTWKTFYTERSGIANFSRLYKKDRQNNTVYARVLITSDKEQIRKLQFGYSDRVKVFFNDQLLYSGNNMYRSRDYRYLGSIGYFDNVYLPLKKGDNKLWMAVSESFGGWGVQARFENMEGISVKTK